jgi:hypothetical protein
MGDLFLRAWLDHHAALELGPVLKRLANPRQQQIDRQLKRDEELEAAPHHDRRRNYLQHRQGNGQQRRQEANPDQDRSPTPMPRVEKQRRAAEQCRGGEEPQTCQLQLRYVLRRHEQKCSADGQEHKRQAIERGGYVRKILFVAGILLCCPNQGRAGQHPQCGRQRRDAGKSGGAQRQLQVVITDDARGQTDEGRLGHAESAFARGPAAKHRQQRDDQQTAVKQAVDPVAGCGRGTHLFVGEQSGLQIQVALPLDFQVQGGGAARVCRQRQDESVRPARPVGFVTDASLGHRHARCVTMEQTQVFDRLSRQAHGACAVAGHDVGPQSQPD